MLGDNDHVTLPFTLVANASDDTGVARVEFWADPYGNSPCEVGDNVNGVHPPLCRFRRFLEPISFFFNASQRQAFLVGTDTFAPFARTLSSAPFGRYKVWARAYDAFGNVADSEMIDVTVSGPRNNLIIILLSPQQQEELTVGTPVLITTDTTEDDLQIASVDFVIDGDLVYTDLWAPYEFERTPTTAGQTVIEAVANGIVEPTKGSAKVNVDVAEAAP